MTPDPTPPVPDTPFCGDLRSKAFYQLVGIAMDESQYQDPSGNCWCYRTQEPFGPDGKSVSTAACRPGRACYRSALAEDAAT